VAVSSDFRDYVLDQLRAVTPVTSKAMFGGVGIYSRGAFFALIADDVLYFKVDDATRGRYQSRGSKPFDPFGKQQLGYYELPPDVLEDEEALREWTREALNVARTKKR